MEFQAFFFGATTVNARVSQKRPDPALFHAIPGEKPRERRYERSCPQRVHGQAAHELSRGSLIG